MSALPALIAVFSFAILKKKLSTKKCFAIANVVVDYE
jgi:threonine/homoserine efflux transporter RhtA